MSEENIAVEANVQHAAAEGGVEAKASNAPEMHEDLLAVIEAKDAELLKVQTERENYKRGMLKAKGKIEDTGSEPEELDELIARKVEERLLATKEVQLAKEKDDAIKALAKRNKELELALKNRSQISNSGVGNSSETIPVSDNVLSQDQIKHLKTVKGWSDAKIETFKQNLLKQKQ